MPNADDQIRGPQLALLISRSRGNEAADFGVFVIDLQHSADALERETHIDIEILGATGGEIVGMRVVLLGKRIGIDLENVLGVVLIEPVQLILVAPR